MIKIYIENGRKKVEIETSMFFSIHNKLAALECESLILVPEEYVNFYEQLESDLLALKRILYSTKEITMSSSLFISVCVILDLSKRQILSNAEREYLITNFLSQS